MELHVSQLATLTPHQLRLADLAFLALAFDLDGFAGANVQTADGERLTWIGTVDALERLRARLDGPPPWDLDPAALAEFGLRRRGWPEEWSLEDPPIDPLCLTLLADSFGDATTTITQLRRETAWRLEHTVESDDDTARSAR